MKNIIYIIVVTLLVLSSLTVVLLYYTQDFSEELDLTTSINFAEIQIETNEFRNNEIFLLSAKSEIGELTLTNNGYFTQVYVLPTIIGCIEIRDNIDANSLLLKNTRFHAEYSSDGATYSDNPYSYNNRGNLKIKVGESRKFTITGVYNPNNVPLSQFTRENIKSISLYRIPEKQTNPLSESSKYSPLRYSNDCTAIDPELDPIAIVNIN
jgi:uncharacterized protein YjfI (DUF2170 family)